MEKRPLVEFFKILQALLSHLNNHLISQAQNYKRKFFCVLFLLKMFQTSWVSVKHYNENSINKPKCWCQMPTCPTWPHWTVNNNNCHTLILTPKHLQEVTGASWCFPFVQYNHIGKTVSTLWGPPLNLKKIYKKKKSG